MRSDLEKYSAEELYLAAIARGLRARDTKPPPFEDFHKVIVMTFDSLFSRDVQVPPTPNKDLLDRRVVLHTIYDIGAQRGDPGWRNFAVEAYRAIDGMASATEIAASEERERNR